VTETVTAAAPAKRKMTGDGSLGFFLYRQGFAIPFSVFLFCFFLLANPHASTPVGGALWMFIPFVVIFAGYLGLTQFLPVILAPIFESHFSTLKDIGVSVWPPFAFIVAAILAGTMGTVQIFGMNLDVDLTWIEIGIGIQVLIAFALDLVMGSVFTAMKNRLASEQGMGRMPGT
jgi:hypothetical protein